MHSFKWYEDLLLVLNFLYSMNMALLDIIMKIPSLRVEFFFIINYYNQFEVRRSTHILFLRV